MRPLIKAWSRDYLQMLSEKHFSKNVLTDSYPMQMQQLSDNSVSMISYQRSLTALTLLNDMFTANSELPQSYFESGDGVGYSPAAKSFGLISSDVRAQVGRTVTIGQVFMYNWNKPEMNLGKILQPFNTAIQRNGDSEGLLKQFDKTPSDVLVVIRQVQQELKVLMSLGMRTAGADGIMIRPNCPPSELIVLKKSPLYVDRAEVESAKTNYSDRIKAIQRTKMGISSQHGKIANGLESLRKVIESNIAQMKGHRAALSKLGMMLFLINEIEEAGIDLAKIPLMQLLAYKSYLE